VNVRIGSVFVQHRILFPSEIRWWVEDNHWKTMSELWQRDHSAWHRKRGIAWQYATNQKKYWKKWLRRKTLKT
jgi:hypothetical protein